MNSKISIQFRYIVAFALAFICANALCEADEAKAMNDKYIKLYQSWKRATETMLPYSKTTVYTNLNEFKKIAACDLGIIPFLKQKIEEDQRMDFVLAIAVVKIEKWPEAEFSTTDMTRYRQLVLVKLNKVNSTSHP